MKKTLYLIRHGLSTANTKGIVQGHLDYPLSPDGQRQARLLNKHLKSNKVNFDLTYSSDLRRAAQTAEITLSDNSKIILTEALREIMLGEWQGRNVDELIADQETWEMWRKTPTKVKITGAESLFHVQQRIYDFISSVCLNNNFQTAAFFSHGGVIALFICRILGESVDRVWSYKHGNTSYSIVTYTDKFELFKHNLSPHIDPDQFHNEHWKSVNDD